MSHSIAIPHHRPSERQPGRHRQLLMGAVLGLIVGILGFGIVEVTVGIVRAVIPSEEAVAQTLAEFPGRELPREWRWEGKTVEFDHMYRQKESPRLDWIRESGRRQ